MGEKFASLVEFDESIGRVGEAGFAVDSRYLAAQLLCPAAQGSKVGVGGESACEMRVDKAFEFSVLSWRGAAGESMSQLAAAGIEFADTLAQRVALRLEAVCLAGEFLGGRDRGRARVGSGRDKRGGFTGCLDKCLPIAIEQPLEVKDRDKILRTAHGQGERGGAGIVAPGGETEVVLQGQGQIARYLPKQRALLSEELGPVR